MAVETIAARGAAALPMELLAPAQGPEQLAMPIHFGADAVYLAAPRWGMRAGARNFSNDELAQAVTAAHAAGVSVHLALNTVMTDADIDELPPFLEMVDAYGVNAAIVADLGVMALVREHAPHLDLHVSTQASVMSAATAEQYARLGARRIVLAREMTVAQIAELRRRLSSEVELEAFCHGSMCMAYSGRCLLSAELMGSRRSPSRGACAQPCRWGWSLVEDRTPDRRIPIEEDARGSYLLSSNDLCMISHLDDLAEAGVASVKVEGRNKGSYYVACVTNAYRHVLDGQDPGPWESELMLVSHRPYSTGFYYGEPTQNPGRVDYARERTMVAVVDSCEPATDGFIAAVTCRNSVDAGTAAQVLSPGAPVREVVLPCALARNAETYRVCLPFAVSPLDVICV